MNSIAVRSEVHERMKYIRVWKKSGCGLWEEKYAGCESCKGREAGESWLIHVVHGGSFTIWWTRVMFPFVVESIFIMFCYFFEKVSDI